MYYFRKLLEAIGLFSVAVIIVSFLLVNKITREKALIYIADENKFRYPTLDWYFKLFNLDTEIILRKILELSKIYGKV